MKGQDISFFGMIGSSKERKRKEQYVNLRGQSYQKSI